MTADEMTAAIGSEAVSEWITVTQEAIDLFAEATGDRQFIHVDPDRAAQTPLGTTIAHGFLTLSLLSQLLARTPDGFHLDNAVMGVNYGGNRVRFLAPVPAGARIRGRTRLVSFDEQRAGLYRYVTDTTVEIEGQDRPAMAAEWIFQVHTQA